MHMIGARGLLVKAARTLPLARNDGPIGPTPRRWAPSRLRRYRAPRNGRARLRV